MSKGELFVISFVAALLVVPIVDYIYNIVQSAVPVLPKA
jgi:hypothetical protein